MDWKAAPQWLADGRLIRCLTDALLRSRARRRLVELDHLDAGRAQTRILRGLVHRARNTRFGRDHAFARIRTPADFRRLVPLRTIVRFWQEYGQQSFPHLNNVLGPEPVAYLLPVADSFGEALPFVPLTEGLLASYRRAALTALALVLPLRPQARLFSGTILFVDSGAAPLALDGHAQAGSLAEVVLRGMPAALRPCLHWTTLSDGGAAFSENWFRVRAGEAVRLPVTCLIGAAGRLQRFFELAQQASRRERITEIWPRLTAVICELDSSGADVRQAVHPDEPLVLQTCFRPEGVLTIEDPRHGLPRLLLDHGLYCEFVPVDTLNTPEPIRLGVEEVETGVPYAVALTSPAGLWAGLLGLTVRFDRRQPLLLGRVETSPAEETPRARVDVPAPLPTPQVSHPRTGDIPAAPPGMPFHTPWSVREGRG